MDLGQTFIRQRNLINRSIIPSVMNNINRQIFPVTDEIIYNILHSLHRHRREEYLKKSRSLIEIKYQKTRKHTNSRRHDVSKKFVTCKYLL